MHKEPGYDHRYDLGHVVLCISGVGVIQGVRKSWGKIAYHIRLDDTGEMVVVFADEVMGFCESSDRKRTQTERLPGL